MAIITLGAPVSGIRGKVGGNVYSANKSGPYLKAWGRGSNPRSTPQTEHRNKLVKFAQAWQNLTAGQQAGWVTYAALPAQDKTNSLGETYSASGFNWFVEINLNLDSAGAVQRNIAPVLAVPAAPITDSAAINITGGSANSQWRVNGADPNLAGFFAIKAVVTNSLGTIAIPNVTPFMITAIPDGARKILFQTEVETKFGIIVLGQYSASTIQSQNADGRRGPATTFSQPVEA